MTLKSLMLLSAVSLLLGLCTFPVSAKSPADLPEGEDAAVTKVIDGDTVEVSIDGQPFTLRYIGIDAPEVKQGNQTFCYASDATEANRKLVEGQTLRLERDKSNTDRFNRLLRYAYLPDGRMVNEELVKLGAAFAKRYRPDIKYAPRLEAVQKEARTAKVGLWGTCIVRNGRTQPIPLPKPPTPTPVPPAPAEPTPTPLPPAVQGGNKVVIKTIIYDGQVARVESDEYAVIANVGTAPVNLIGWHLNAGDDGQDFIFPAFELQPGQVCRVYTNQVHPESCGFSFGSGKAIWNNKGECGYLFDAAGLKQSEFCY